MGSQITKNQILELELAEQILAILIEINESFI